MRKIYLLIVAVVSMPVISQAQCTFAVLAAASGDTLHCVAGDANKTVVAYNPVDQIYYSVDAGGSVPEEYFDASGTSLGTSANADWRGLWWNATENLVEGNAWDDAFIGDSLTASGFLGGGLYYPFMDVTSAPFNQCAGVLDDDANTILYYYNDTLWGESRANLADITPVPLTGLPSFANIVRATLVYTGCPGHEVGLYNHITKTLLLFNKLTGALTDSVNLPSDAPGNLTADHYWGIAFANDLFWVYDASSNKWIAYDIFENTAGVEEVPVTYLHVYPNPVEDVLNVRTSAVETLEIYSTTGQCLYIAKANDYHLVNISDYAPGIYLLKVGNGLRKIIKL